MALLGPNEFTLQVLKPEYCGIARSTPRLLMPWLLASLGHWPPWYWPCRINRSLSSTRRDFNNLCHLSEMIEIWICLHVSCKRFSMRVKPLCLLYNIALEIIIIGIGSGLSPVWCQAIAQTYIICVLDIHDDVIKWKHFPRYRPFVRGIHRSPVNSPHKGQWRRALMFLLICTRINGCVNNGEAGDLRHYSAHVTSP